MAAEIRPGSAPGPGRIALGIVLMLLVALWTFATPAAQADDNATEAVGARILQNPGGTGDAEGERFDARNTGQAPLDLVERTVRDGCFGGLVKAAPL